MTVDIGEFKNYLAINRSSLDDELARQASIYYEIGEAYIDAVAERDMLKEKLATVDAALDGEMRMRHDKVTEAQVKNKVQVDGRHIEASDRYLEAKTKADKLGVLKEAFAQRGYMMRDLCQLYISNYFSESSVQGNSITDTAAYRKQRERIALSREKR